MRELIREGATVETLGRFGRVEKGSRVFVTEEEFASVRYSPEWREVEVSVEGLVPEAVPCETEHYNLLSIDWRSDSLSNALRRLGWATIQRVAKAMDSLGIPVPTGHPASREQVVDSIVEMADRHGWTGHSPS